MSSSDGAAVAPQDVRTREELGAALTALRLASGLSVRDVARRSGLPLATVGGYLSGRHLPPLATLDQFAGLLTVLAVPDEAAPAWLDAVTRLRRVPGPRPAAAVAPYLGLRAYQADDSALFFGREAATDHLVGLLSSAPGTPVVVVGSSGSGKSSLLRAGVQARLAADGRPVTVVTPGTDPTGVVPEPADLAHGGVLVVDQFEELFTADVAQDQVTAVVAGLGRLHDEGTVVVVALRADFFDAAVQVPELAAWLAATQVLVGPLSTDDLRRVVVEPARVAGVEVDDGLVELLIADATAGSSTRAGLDAGALPLASHALYVTWLAASGRRLTLEQYRQVGRLAGAIAQTAETVHNQLTPEAEAVEKATFLRLVRVSGGTVDPRRVADTREFAAANQAVISAYVAARLLTSDRGQVQIAHEALLTAWPRMREWLDADREGRRVHGRLTDAARRWQDMEHDPDLLYRGAALETADRWVRDAANPPDLSAGERDFLDRSRAAERSRLDARRRGTWRLRALAAGLAVLTTTTATLAGVSASQARASEHQTDLAVSRQLAVQAESLAATDPALAGQLAVAADQRAETVEARSALLSASGRDPVTRTDSLDAVVPSVAVSPDGATLAAVTGDGLVVLETTGPQPRRLARMTTGDTSLYQVTFSPDGSLLAAVGDGGLVRLWDVHDPTSPTRVATTAPAAGATYYDVVFTPDGSRIVAGASDGTVHLLARDTDGRWSQAQTVTATKGTVQAVALDRSGALVAAAGSAASVTLWSLTASGLSPVGAAFPAATTKVTSLAFSPDGGTLAAGSTDAGVHLWDVHRPAAPTEGLTLTGPASWTNHVAYSPDGTAIAAASSDQHLWVWDATTGVRLDSFTHPTTLLTAAWSPDGGSLFSAGSDGILRTWRYPGATLQGFSSIPGQGVFGASVIATATTDGLRLWDAAAGGRHRLLSVSPAPGGAHLDGAIGIDDPLHLVVAGDTTGHVHFWDVSDPTRPTYRGAVAAHKDWVDAVAFDSTGTRMAVSSDDASITTWDLSGALPTAPTGRIGDLGGFVYAVSFAPDDTTLVASVLSGHVDLLDASDLAHPALVGRPLTGPKGYVYSAAFSPDGRTIAASGNDKTIWLWDVSDRAHPRALGAPLVWADGYATNILFSPDGHRLAAGMTDGTVRVWDVADPASPQRYASLTGVTGEVYGVAFSTDGSQVSGAGSDRTVRVWDLTTQAATAAVCAPARAGLTMTADEWSRLAGPLTKPTLCG